MKKNLLLRLLFTLVWIAGLVSLGYYFIQPAKVVQALGVLTINLPSSPLFSVNNWLPGDTEQKQFEVINSSDVMQQLAVRVSRIEFTPLASLLGQEVDVRIFDNLGNFWYGAGSAGGNKTMADFQSESYVLLGALNSGASVDYTIELHFQTDAGNDVQRNSLLFDLTFMEELVGPNGEPLPEECSAIVFSGSAIIGTNNTDRLRGDNGNNLIWALDGDDLVWGYGGHDCIIGGSGNDRVWGGTGKDYIFGQAGLNALDGGSDEDMIIGGQQDDYINGGSDPDKIYGLSGNDELDGGSGDDRIWAGEGNDLIDAGSGRDFVSADIGNDRIYGGSGNDRLLGDSGVDWIDGQTGTDTCQAETKLSCEL